jgi:flagellar hook-associated protein FlgK
MSFGIGLGAGLKALMAARLGIETTGQNVANANTPGYSRQRIMQSASLPFTTAYNLQVGTGVDITDIQRITDSGLERRLRLQMGQFASSRVDYGRWREIEGTFNEPDGGLSEDLSNFFARLQSLETSPESAGLRSGVTQGGRALANSLNHLAQRFGEIEDSSFHEISGHLLTVNQLAQDIANLNGEIATIETGRATANDLRDTRELKIKQIGELMNVQVIDRGVGAVNVIAGGQILVSGTTASQLSAVKNASGQTEVFSGKSKVALKITNGTIGGLMRHEQVEIPGLLGKLDRLAHNLALEFNRLHSTGVPSTGSYDHMKGAYGVTDANGNGTLGDELLSQSGLPFDMTNGDLWVTVVDKATGAVDRSRVSISPAAMSLQDLASALDSIDNLSASIDATGHLQVSASSGYGFDFSNRLDPNPDGFGSFGGDAPVIGSSAPGPFNLTVPSTLQININGTPTNINFTSANFLNPSAATAEEVATAINSQLGAGGEARAVSGRLVIRANATGPSATLSLADVAGTPLAQLGLSAGPTTGTANGVEVSVFGQYTGKTNGEMVFLPDGDGEIGVTAGLTIGVFDSGGKRIATLDAGPGTELLTDQGVEVADGVMVKMTQGQISSTDGDVFALDTLADSDTSDALVALGMNSFFLGNTAADLTVNPDLEASPSLFAAALSGSSSDPSNLERMLALRNLTLSDLDSNTLENFYNRVVADVGFETAGAETILEGEDQLLASIEDERQSISGVNLDEEMINLVQYQQAFEAASRLINVINDMTTTLVNLGR